MIRNKILGLDLGSRTLGIALSDALGLIASGVETFRFKENELNLPLQRVLDLISENKIEKVVLGYPKHMNGDEGEKAQISKKFKEMIESKCPVEVILIDERWTTTIAQNRLISANMSRDKRKKIIDKMAAVVILQDYLDSIKG